MSNAQPAAMPATENPSSIGRLRPVLIDATLGFLVSRLIFLAGVLIGIIAIPEYAGSLYAPWHTGTPALIDAAWRWDAGWYLSIARDGYVWNASGESNTVFFPLFPLLLRLVSLPFEERAVFTAGVLLNHAQFFGALVAVRLYVARLAGRDIARRAVVLLTAFPGALFFNAAYSESLFLLLTAVTFVLLQRRRFAGAAIAGGLAGLTRPTGLLLAVPYLIAVRHARAENRGERLRQVLPVLLIPAGAALYAGFLWWRFGDPFLFMSGQAAWAHTRMFPPVALVEALAQIARGDGTAIAQLMNAVNTGAAVLAIILGIALARVDRAAAAYTLLGVLLPLSVPIAGAPTISMARYVAVLFPMFIPLACWSRHRWVMPALVGVAVPLQILLAALFTRWYWII